jgi:hypothetical protein
MEGTVQGSELIEALRTLSGQKKTGILTIQGQEEIIAVSFLEGSVVGADALNQALAEGLSEVLMSLNLIDPSDFGGLVAEHEAGGGRVTDLLVERSLLTRAQLLEALRLHIYELCLGTLTWRSGEYRFYEGEEVAHEEGIEPITVEELLVCATEDLGEAGPLPGPLPELETVYRGIKEVLGDEGEFAPAVAIEELDRHILEIVNGQRSLKVVGELAGVSRFYLQERLSRWERAGIVERVERPESTVQEDAVAPESVEPVESQVAEPGPEPEAEKPRRKRERRRRFVTQISDAVPIWASRIFALVLLAAALVILVLNTPRILLPFPWQGGLREALRKEQLAVRQVRIDQAARIFFLLYGRYPEELSELVADRLLNPEDILDPQGGVLTLGSSAASYVVQVTRRGDPLNQSSFTGSIADNFLLDPDFLLPSRSSAGPPLVLLD